MELEAFRLKFWRNCEANRGILEKRVQLALKGLPGHKDQRGLPGHKD